MIKLFSLKQKKDGDPIKGTQKKSSAAQLRIQKGKKIEMPQRCYFRMCLGILNQNKV